MGWKRDWLFRLIFAKYLKLWEKVKKSADLNKVRPPLKMYILQHEKAEILPGSAYFCRGEIARCWELLDGEFIPVDQRNNECIVQDAGRFHEVAIGRFHIYDDRKRVVIEFFFGPRYGGGAIYIVKGQGKRGCLFRDEDGPLWTS